MLVLSRKVRRSQDIGALLRSVVRGDPNAVGVRIRGQHLLLLVDPALVGELLIEHAGQTVKSPAGSSHRRSRRAG
jgi:hypothetical protein